MKKQTAKKIISGAMILIFAMFFLQAISPEPAYAAKINWENPNKKGNNPYKFKVTDSLNSQLIMQVVGCTGIVDKVSAAITGLFQKRLTAKKEEIKEDVVRKICGKAKGAAEGTAAATDKVGTQFTNALKDIIGCNDAVVAKMTPTQIKDMYDQAAARVAEQKRTECLNGIAYTLAKNQLTAMTRYTMNWVNSGFNGDPLYVQNITRFTNSVQREVIEDEINALTYSGVSPYGAAFSRYVISGYGTGAIRGGANSLVHNLSSSLSNFVTDPTSYVSDSKLSDRERRLLGAERSNKAFSNDFATGGWNAYLGLTQIDANNPLGFSMLASEELAREQEEKVAEVKNEISENNGFLSQKKCVKYESAADIAAANSSFNKISSSLSGIGSGSSLDETTSGSPTFSADTSASTTKKCVKWEVVTPGSLIKDKVTSYINSPDRQLELADDINSVLNSVFSMLISQFQNQGLKSLKSEDYEYTDTSMGGGVGSNNINFGDNESLGGGFTDGSFDLTRDLGNKFIYNYTDDSYLGTWNASTNSPKLTTGIGPVIVGDDGENIYLTNVYYTVSVPGKTQIFDDGYSGWEAGDKAFWNGSDWQNWKNGTPNPIRERGIIQVQKDFVVAAKGLLQEIPAIMPKMGELDYCIPGPNLDWQNNSGDIYTAFTDYAYSLSSDYKDGSFFTRDSSTYKIAKEGQKEYDNYKKLFTGTEQLFAEVKNTASWKLLNSLGTMGTIKKDRIEDTVQSQIEIALTGIEKNLENFNSEYKKIVDSRYGSGSLMQSPYLEEENTAELLENTAYLPVAETGSNLTKDILNYSLELDKTVQDYKDYIIQANSNVYKLDKIKDEVSKIIKAAQGRRDARLLEILKAESERNGTPIMSAAAYKEKYKNCLDEENIVFYDDLEIMGQVEEGGRCQDNLDNDLDGFVDEQDPDCTGYTNSSGNYSGDEGTGTSQYFGPTGTAFD